ncbi:lysis protein [Phage f2b1]|nr:lysis protein [Phage f2b1]
MDTMNTSKPVVTAKQTVDVPLEAPKLSVKLVAITIFYLLVIVNGVAAMFGVDLHISPNYDGIYEGVSALAYVAAFAFGVWKNHNFTKAARVKSAVAKQVDTKNNL